MDEDSNSQKQIIEVISCILVFWVVFVIWLLFKKGGLRTASEYLLAVHRISVLFMLIRMVDLFSEKYLQEVWPIVRGALKEQDISCELNLVEGSMTVSTTRKTTDPYIIVKARDHIKLLSRSVPAPQQFPMYWYCGLINVW